MAGSGGRSIPDGTGGRGGRDGRGARIRVWKRPFGAAVLALLWLCATAPAQAAPGTLRLGIEDMVMGVADVAASPVTGGTATVRNLDEVSDNVVLQGLYAVPSFLGLTVLQAAQGALRVATGGLEVVVGVLVFPFPGDRPGLGPGFNVFRRDDPLIDLENPLGSSPPWLAWVLPITPLTIDARIAPVSPWALYTPPVETAQRGRAPAASDGR